MYFERISEFIRLAKCDIDVLFYSTFINISKHTTKTDHVKDIVFWQIEIVSEFLKLGFFFKCFIKVKNILTGKLRICVYAKDVSSLIIYRDFDLATFS